jgi:hypothetical protein
MEKPDSNSPETFVTENLTEITRTFSQNTITPEGEEKNRHLKKILKEMDYLMQQYLSASGKMKAE